MVEATTDAPIYRKVHQERSGETSWYMIVCDEGWRQTIVCADVYEDVAEWFLSIVGRKPFIKARAALAAHDEAG